MRSSRFNNFDVFSGSRSATDAARRRVDVTEAQSTPQEIARPVKWGLGDGERDDGFLFCLGFCLFLVGVGKVTL